MEAIVEGFLRELPHEGLEEREIVLKKRPQRERHTGAKQHGLPHLPPGGLQRKMAEVSVAGERRIIKRRFGIQYEQAFRHGDDRFETQFPQCRNSGGEV